MKLAARRHYAQLVKNIRKNVKPEKLDVIIKAIKTRQGKAGNEDREQRETL